ncbi:MAG: hypothetical protein Q9163_002305 [Psora crenata]
MRNLTQTPKTPGRQLPSSLLNNAFHSPIRNRAVNNSVSARGTPQSRGNILSPAARDVGAGETTLGSEGSAKNLGSTFDDIPRRAVPDTTSPKAIGDGSTARWDSGNVTNYGSFIPSPESQTTRFGPPALELPDPALPADEEGFDRHNRAWRQSRLSPSPHNRSPAQQVEGIREHAHEVGRRQMPAKSDSAHLLPKHKRLLRPRRAVSTPHGGASPFRPRVLRRFFSSTGPGTPAGDIPEEAYKECDIQQAKFFSFLDDELEKIESFYKLKEKEATGRLQALREQLHELRDRMLQEQEAKAKARRYLERVTAGHEEPPQKHFTGAYKPSVPAAFKWIRPIESAIGMGPSRIGKSSKDLQILGTPVGFVPQHLPDSSRPVSWQDFTKRPAKPDDVSYRFAKRQLKLALQEFYKGLELLKSYALLNRTAFRKINKKYDKVVKARPTGRYISEKVNKAWFVQSEVLDGHIVAVEDLYARYFERGNHKVAVGKLRSKASKPTDYTGSVFRNGMLLAGAGIFGIQGVVNGAEHLSHPDSAVRTDTGYLLQIYGGYFLMLFLFLIFCLDCKIWSRAKINYPFIFEFDTRHNLDWRLCNPYSEQAFLRDVLGYKRPWVYYLAMVIDPILRFNWIFYAIYSNDLQHSALLSFFVAFSEVCRRGIWSLFRVENEHCTNVGRFRALRDVRLPYTLPSALQRASPADETDERYDQEPSPIVKRKTYTDPITGASSTSIRAQRESPRLRRRVTLVESNTPIIRGIVRVGTAINEAHAQDFERKRDPVDAVTGEQMIGSSPPHGGTSAGQGGSSDEEEEDEEMEGESRAGEVPVEIFPQETEQDTGEPDGHGMLRAKDALGRRQSAVG